MNAVTGAYFLSELLIARALAAEKTAVGGRSALRSGSSVARTTHVKESHLRRLVRRRIAPDIVENQNPRIFNAKVKPHKMEPDRSNTPLANRRPMNSKDLAKIAAGIRRPKEVDETLATSVIQDLMKKYQTQIRGTETNPRIKEALNQEEVEEQARAARLQIKLSSEVRHNRNYPSLRDEALPKYFTREERKRHRAEWIAKIEAELTETFSLEQLYLEQGQVRFLMDSLAGARTAAQLPPINAKLRDSLLEFFGSTPINVNTIDLVEDVMVDYFGHDLQRSWNDFNRAIETLNSGEVKLTEGQIETALAGIDFSKYYQGETTNIVMDPAVNEVASKKIKKQVRRQLMQIKMKPDLVPRLIELILERFERSLSLPGKWVGNIMASSFGEAATQQTLNTFHAAGDRSARKQITGFAKFESIYKAVENPQSSTMIIFMKAIMNAEQLKSQLPNIQMTVLADLIEFHEIIKAGVAVPRWEQIADMVNGINPLEASHDGKYARLNLHRGHRLFVVDPLHPERSTGRILKIKFNVRELFFRRISLSQIARVIEDQSRNYRVVTSSLDVGTIHLFFNFEGIASIKSTKRGETTPAFITDEFEFALNNLIYPSLLSLQVGGIYGVEYVSVGKFDISTAIDFTQSHMELNSPTARVHFQFSTFKVLLWALTPAVIGNFMMAKLRKYQPIGFEMRPTYDPEEMIYSIDTMGLRKHDYVTSRDGTFDMKGLQAVLQASGNDIRVYELLRSTYAGPGQVATSLVVNDGDAATRYAFANPNTVVIDFDQTILDGLGITLTEITELIASVPEFKDLRVTNNFTNLQSQVFIDGVNFIDLQIKVGKVLYTTSLEFIVAQLKLLTITSDKLERDTLRWFYRAEGKNLNEVLMQPEIDAVHTRSDNIVEIFRVLGDEASRVVALDEIANNTDAKINPVHIELLADALTYRTPGDKPLSQDHYGMTKRGAEFIGRMFEMTTKGLMESGLGYVDNLQSFPSQIMLGKLDNAGLLTKEDREIIKRDKDVFKYDFPREVAAIAQAAHVDSVPIPGALLNRFIQQIPARFAVPEQRDRPRVGVMRRQMPSAVSSVSTIVDVPQGGEL